MNILGIGGGLDLVYEQNFGFPTDLAHDASAVLIKDDRVVAGIEEERISRIKHTNKAPIFSIKFCLEEAGLALNEVDKIAVYGSEEHYNLLLQRLQVLKTGHVSEIDVKSLIHTQIEKGLQTTFDPSRIVFVPHHICHATSAYAASGFDSSLILTIDGQGDGISCTVMDAGDNKFEVLDTFYDDDSLGFFYLNVIRFLGYEMFDEYKVMGLAPYGNPKNYRSAFKKMYSLLPDGKYKIHGHQIDSLLQMMTPRGKGDPFTQEHKDVAASLQEALEEIVFHILSYYQMKTGHTRLCMAGGVAHNCTLNGKIMYSGLFKDIFVHPAAHDSGAALGAALYIYHRENTDKPPIPFDHLYWGTDIGSDREIEQELSQWADFVTVERMSDSVQQTARLIEQGNVIGWVQGRSEFGPRALGNRSIVADPRPEENKAIINEMVKMREGYRPFAPSVLEEDVREYFVTPAAKSTFPYMIFVLKVKQDKQKLLGAVTHVDGTARVQTVSKETNPKYWALIDAFKQLSGVPVVLNTSFNNNVEPIVDTVRDAVVCYLTTKLNYLVVGDYLVSKKESLTVDLLKLAPSLPVFSLLHSTQKYSSLTEITNVYQLSLNYSDKYTTNLSPELYHMLVNADGKKSFLELLEDIGPSLAHAEELGNKIFDLWSRRLIRLSPLSK